jgi:glycerol-3-phosphate dehydrogenase
MREPLSEQLRDWYEVAVIGGGINGSGIAQALAEAGYSVVLLERGDFGSGTTSRSTRLIHGGLRYLEHAEFSLVYESLREREALFNLYPHLVKPLELLLPIYEGGAYPRWKAWAGLTLYDLFSPGRSLPNHVNLSLQKTLAREPMLRTDGLRAGFSFWDGQVDLAERLAVEAALAARLAGATVVNYAEVTALRTVSMAGDRSGFALGIEDLWGGARSHEVEADVVINATGPWVDELLDNVGVSAPRQLGGTRGSHLVLRSGALDVAGAVYAPARSDGRPFFVIPWLGMTLIGTTDIRHDAAAAAAVASDSEVAYLLDETNHLLNSDVRKSDILYAYCGMRPLPYESEGKEGKITRRHFLVDHGPHGFPGLYSLVGGKLTTHRSVGRKAVDAVRKRIGERWPYPVAKVPQGKAPSSFQSVWGMRAADVYSRYGNEPALLEPICEHSPEPLAVVVEASRQELATTLADVFLRRTLVGWRECQGLHIATSAAQLLAEELGWDQARRASEVERYQSELNTVHPPPGTATSAVVHAAPV